MDGSSGKKTPLVELTPRAALARLNLLECYDVIIEIFFLYGFEVAGDSCDLREKTVETWLQVASHLDYDWIKFMKHKLAAFYSYHWNQVIPDRDDERFESDNPRFLIGGGARKWQRLFFRDSNKDTSSSFLSSILNSKKGMPMPDEEYIEEKMEGTVDALTSEKPQEPNGFLVEFSSDPHPQLDVYLSKDNVKSQLRRTVKELFEGLNFTMEDFNKPFFPSTSSNYLNTREGAGAVGTILEDGELMKLLRSPGGSLEVKKRKRRTRWRVANGPADKPVFPDEETREQEREEEYVYDDRSLNRRFALLMARIREKAMVEEPLVKAVGLPEALKVRTISKGPPLTYTALRPVWKFIHRILRRHKTFQLIGKPDDRLVMLEILGRVINDDEIYLSGDYSAATDNLHSWASEAVADAISDEIGLPPDLKELFKRALTGHIFVTPEGKKEQKSGQLMGSIVSFPVLCIINAAMCRWSMELAENKVKKLRDCALAINGDDVVLRSKEKVYPLWSRITGFVGLKESIGKTFQSRKFFNINSKTYYRIDTPDVVVVDDPRRGRIERSIPFREAAYVNMGTLMGYNRSGEFKISDQDDPRATMSAKANTLLRFCPTFLLERVYRLFLKRNKRILDSTGLPWFIPEWLGGLGLPNILPEYNNSETDLRVARKILLGWNKRRPVHLAQGETPWYIRQAATSALPSPFQTIDKDAIAVERWKHLTSLKSVDLLFNSDVSLTDIFDNGLDVDYDPETGRGSMKLIQVPSRTRVNAAIRHNQSLWRPKGNLPEPIPEEIIGGSTRYEGLRINKFSDHSTVPVAPSPISMKQASLLHESNSLGGLSLD